MKHIESTSMAHDNGPHIIIFSSTYQQQVIDLIVGIQSGEFGVNITAADQPDLSDITDYYQQGNGQFWIAIDNQEVLGTIALSDIGNQQVALRKMFVKQGFRGQPLAIGQRLIDTALYWSQQKQVTDIYLGTVPDYHAAHKFYEKNGFLRVETTQLPEAFVIMEVDKYFYHLPL